MENKLDTPVSPNQIGITLLPFEITNDVLEKASKYVISSKTAYESQRQSWLKELAEWDRAYRVILEDEDNRTYVGLSDKAAPIVHDNTEAIVSRLTESILPTDKDLVKLETKSDNRGLEKYRSDELNNQLEKLDIQDKADSVARVAVKFGTALIKVPMVNTEKTVLTRQIVTETVNTPIIDDKNEPIIDPQTGQPMVHTETKQSVKIVPETDRQYFGPGYQVIDNLEDVYVDPLIEKIEDQPIIIHRILVTWDYIQEQVGKGILIPEQVQKIKGKTFDSYSTWNNDRKTENSGMGAAQTQDGKPRLYEIFQAYCDFSLTKGDEETIYPCVITVCGNTTIGLSANPYFHQQKPFLKVVYRKIEGEFYGEGAIQPIIDLFQEYCDTMNQISDAKILALNPIKIQRGSAAASKQDLDIEPGTTWYEQNSGDIRFAAFDFSPVQNGLQYLELLEQRINRGMGITPLMMGQGDQTDLDKTWRGTNKIIAQADKKFKSIAKNIEDVAIRDWAEMAYKLNCQFSPLIGMDGSFQQINEEPDFVVEGVDSFFEKQEKILNLQLFIQHAGQVPGINIPGLVNESADLLGIDIDEAKYGPLYMPPPPPLPESKPMNFSVNIPLDPSKGTWMAMAAADLLNKKEGLQLDLDAIGQAGAVITYNTPEEAKRESGILPPQKDSYSKSDPRTEKKK